MQSSPPTDLASLLSQTNEIIENIAVLNSNLKLYKQVHSLQENLNTLEEKYKSLQTNKKNLKCNKQCKKLNTSKDQNSVDDFLIHLLLSKSISNPPPTVPENVPFTQRQVINDERASAPPLGVIENENENDTLRQASAPPLNENDTLLQASAPPL